MLDDAAEQVRAAGREVIHTIRELALFEAPVQPYLLPPHDLEAEQYVISMVLDGHYRPSQLPCRSPDFYLALHRFAFSVVEALEDRGLLDGQPDIVKIAKVLSVRGGDPDRIAAELEWIRDRVPYTVALEEYAERVVERAHQRRTIAAMQQLDNAWRVGGEADVGAVIEMLRRWA